MRRAHPPLEQTLRFSGLTSASLLQEIPCLAQLLALLKKSLSNSPSNSEVHEYLRNLKEGVLNMAVVSAKKWKQWWKHE